MLIAAAIVICEKELRSMMHNPTERLFRLIKPMLWIVLFGAVFKVVNLPSGIRYQQFMLPGILIQTTMITGLGHGITLKWESDLGILNRMLVAPVRRASIVLGKAFSSVAKALMEAAVFLTLAALIQIGFSHNPLILLLTAMIITFFVVGVSSLGMIMAVLLRTREAYTGVVGLIATPALFASNSLYNIDQMPAWLRLIAEVNPLTYAVDFARRILIYQTFDPIPLLRDAAGVGVFMAIVLFAAIVMFRKIVV